jgi:hypothetical protein
MEASGNPLESSGAVVRFVSSDEDAIAGHHYFPIAKACRHINLTDRVRRKRNRCGNLAAAMSS